MSTPHISAPDGAFAPSVLLPGDPLRARWIATELLSDASEVTEVRGILGYTGSWRGRRVSVMGTGMGVPSMNIYATELARHYGVTRLVRIGSCGAIDDRVGLRDLIVVSGASTDSSVNRRLVAGHDFAATPDFALTRALVERRDVACKRLTRRRVDIDHARRTGVHLRHLLWPAGLGLDLLRASGHLAVEMEAAGLFGVAASEGVAAAALLTVSDHLNGDTHLSAQERQVGFSAMAEVALDAVTV